MKEEPLYPWIEPELEVRITALVLGEASDFEREELERLIEEKAELAMFRKRMEAVHGLLREVAAGEMGADDDDWKLGDERRQAVLAVIDGEAREKLVENVVKENVVNLKPKRRNFFGNLAKIAAILLIPTIVIGILMLGISDYGSPSKIEGYAPPAYANKEATKEAPYIDAETGDSASSYSPPIADSASVAKPDPVADSRSSLAAIQGNLDAYSNSPQESIPSSGSTSSVAVAGDKIEMPKVDRYLSADAGSGGVIRGVTGQAINGRVNLKDGTESLAANVDEDVSFEIAKLKDRVSTRSPSQNPSFDSPPLPASSIVTPEFSQTETPDVTLEVVEEEMAKIPHFGENKPNLPAKRRNRVAGELAESDMALKKSIGDPFSESAPAAAAMDDKADGVSVSSLVSSQDSFADTQAVRKMDRDGEAKGAKLGADREEMLAARQLAEAQSPMARGQIAAADAPQPALEEMAAGQGGAARKKEKAQDPSALAPAAPAGSRPAPAVTPMLAKKEELRGKGMKSSAEREADDKMKSNYASTARNETRAEFFTEVAAGWELPVPTEIREGVDLNRADKEASSKTGGDIPQDLERFTPPQHEFQNYPGSNKDAMDKAYQRTPQVVAGGSVAGKARMKPGTVFDEHGTEYVVDSQAPKMEKQDLLVAADKTTAAKPAQQLGKSGKGTASSSEKEGIAPSDLWFRAFALMKEGEDLEKGQEESAAYNKFKESKRLFDAVANEHPDFHPEIVRFRREELGNKIAQSAAATKGTPTDPMEAIAGSKEQGFFLRDAKLNDVFSMLAKSAGLNYFHNPALEGSEYLVTGRLQEGGDPLSQMEELGLMYGVTFLQDGKTVQSLKAAEKKPAAPSGLDEKSADEEAFSTFSLHVSDVSFKLAQAALAKGEWPEASKVRIEEFVNAFDYGDPMPDQNEKVASRMEQAIHPFLQQRNLLRVSMRTAAAGRSGDTPLRLTLLLDNSGSMERIDRQKTVRRAFALLAQQLKPIDQVTLISFARQPRLLADKVSGAQVDQLVQLVANIPSEGGTNLEAALQLAFEKAREQKIDTAQNRVIMLTDGAANLGDADPDSLAQMVETMRDAGIAFDAAGIGAEGLNDEILEALTRKGDGRYYLLDQPEDADEGFARQIAGALRPAAKNVKVQVEFNPERVGKYKLLGFEKHLLKKEDFRNDKVDAAEMAAAEAGVAVYQFEAKPDGRGDVGSVSVRFLDMSSGQMVEKRWPIPYQADAPRLDEAAPSLRIAATAALLAAKLKGEALGQSVDLKTLSNYTAGLPDRYRNAQRVQQLQEMINQARAASR